MKLEQVKKQIIQICKQEFGPAIAFSVNEAIDIYLAIEQESLDELASIMDEISQST